MESTATNMSDVETKVEDASIKMTKLHVDRIKKEDEEEQWISGEELYTDGSSDEDGKKGTRRRHKREHKGARPKEKPASKCSETCSAQKPALHILTAAGDSDAEEPIDISWKPKRGSIKLPHMVREMDITTPSTTSAGVEPITE